MFCSSNTWRIRVLAQCNCVKKSSVSFHFVTDRVIAFSFAASLDACVLRLGLLVMCCFPRREGEATTAFPQPTAPYDRFPQPATIACLKNPFRNALSPLRRQTTGIQCTSTFDCGSEVQSLHCAATVK